MKIKTALLAAACAALLSFSAQAALTITVSDVGPNAVFSGVGSLDTTGLVDTGNTNAFNGYIFSGGGEFSFNAPFPDTATTLKLYTGITGGGVFGNTSPSGLTTNTGDALLMGSDFSFPQNNTLGLPASYVSGALLTIAATRSGGISGLGLSLGDTVWTLPSNDTLTLRVVPEPGTYAALFAAAALGLAAWRKKTKD